MQNFKISLIPFYLAALMLLLTLGSSPIWSNTTSNTIDNSTENTETSEDIHYITRTVEGIDLTVEEKAWLGAHPVIRVGADPAWSPLEFIGNNGEYQGIAIDYLEIIERSLGIRFQFVRENWQDLIELAKKQ